MEITNPRRILVLGAPDAGVLNLLKGILLEKEYQFNAYQNTPKTSPAQRPSKPPIQPPV
jgi:hypothetical protein